MKQRITYIDSAKGMLIALVVGGHVLNYANPGYDILPYTLVQVVITSFHMPAFFLLSGLLAEETVWRERSFLWLVKSRCRTLLIPYLFFETVAILYKCLVLHSLTLREGLYRMVTLRCNVGADWFLPAMLLANVLFWLYARCPGRYRWIPALIVAFTVPPLFPAGHGWGLLFRGVLGFGFMLLGQLLRQQLTRIKPMRVMAAFLLMAAASAAGLKLGLGNDFYGCALDSPLLFIVSGVCGTYVVLALAQYMDWRWLRVIGTSSLTIMGTHQLVLYTVGGSASPLWVAAMLLLIAGVETVVVLVTNHFCPFLVGKSRKET